MLSNQPTNSEMRKILRQETKLRKQEMRKVFEELLSGAAKRLKR